MSDGRRGQLWPRTSSDLIRSLPLPHAPSRLSPTPSPCTALHCFLTAFSF